jgi:hypothetical protein
LDALLTVFCLQDDGEIDAKPLAARPPGDGPDLQSLLSSPTLSAGYRGCNPWFWMPRRCIENVADGRAAIAQLIVPNQALQCPNLALCTHFRKRLSKAGGFVPQQPAC